ncbi:MAG: FAD:protein FMN transferase [Candidatus Omnitrophica bacterium]|nr:FAD:protein FMN transferase [Candidatus Omnitrophota bacterium]MBU1367600.1 FAD:protein FMN transferase [Candidatus Omnitrophota bacterium]MBU1523876.1 FAD:protein FMN transferase [Candidatus Omnitrophota bacterium]MBU1809996.1 FAD:protein FMN transferase [Candidatus Omnitrophota bacterium]MBU2436526.1 FAD:protein FMN transferase [Candidatus Omnitrophota bacterium]
MNLQIRHKVMVYGLWFMVYGLILCSCTKTSLYKDKFVISGTYLEVASPCKEAASVVYAEFKRLDKIFNFYDPQSEISRLNKTYNTPFNTSEELIEILVLSKQASQLTNNAFDVSCGSLYDFWKKWIRQNSPKELPSKEEVEKLKRTCGMHNLEINYHKNTVLIKKQGLKIDLGGIAKGYMVDKAVLKLKEKGIDSALINAGGDIYCLGKNGDNPWSVGVKDPKGAKEIIETERLVDEAIATSGNYEQFFQLQGKRYSHIIDPRSGYPVQNNISSVSVISEYCSTTDGLATAFFVMGLEGIKEFLARTPSTMRIFVVTQDEKGMHTHIFK